MQVGISIQFVDKDKIISLFQSSIFLSLINQKETDTHRLLTPHILFMERT